MLSCSDEELLPISWLSQYGYCPRRCGLLVLEQVWQENELTAAGTAQHNRVHTARAECRGSLLTLYEFSVFSRLLGLTGLCDCVEARASPDGVCLPYGKDRYLLYPIEYKHGTVRQEEEYHIQLCAQALCLEEQFDTEIPKGAIFYIGAHRRDEVLFSPCLRNKTKETLKELKAMIEKQRVPDPSYGPKCKKCSLAEYCQPKLRRSAQSYCRGLWDVVLEGKEA